MKKIVSFILTVIMTLCLGVSAFAAPAKASDGGKTSASPKESYSMIWHRAMTDFGDALGAAGGRDRTVFIDFKAGANGSGLRFQFNNLDPKQGELKAMTVFVNGKCYQVTYKGDRDIKVPGGKIVYSDPVNVTVKRNDPIQIRIFYHKIAVGFNSACNDGPFTKKGNQTETNYKNGIPMTKVERDLSTLAIIPLLSAMEIKATQPIQSIVVFGDSIIAHNRWVRPLAQRVSDYYGGKYSVLNSGISGNCLSYVAPGAMGKFFGEKGTDRFQRDVLDLTNVHTVILCLGVNDVSYMTDENKNELNVDKMIADTTSLVKELRAKGIHVVAQTITPRKGYFNGLSEFTDQQEQYRQQYNAWLRSCGLFDYLIDFDACVRDPQHPDEFREGLHQGDHLHPSVEGGKVMANYVDLDKLV